MLIAMGAIIQKDINEKKQAEEQIALKKKIFEELARELGNL